MSNELAMVRTFRPELDREDLVDRKTLELMQERLSLVFEGKLDQATAKFQSDINKLRVELKTEMSNRAIDVMWQMSYRDTIAIVAAVGIVAAFVLILDFLK